MAKCAGTGSVGLRSDPQGGRSPSFRASLLLGCSLLLGLLPGFSQAQPESQEITLSQGRQVRLKLSPNEGRNLAIAKFVREPALNPLRNPLGCPNMDPWVRLKAAGGYDSGRQALPCDQWTGSPSNRTYKDRAGTQGGVRLVRYRVGSLQVQWKGSHFPAVARPLPADPWVEISFGWSGEAFACGRFSDFRKNKSSVAVAGAGSTACLPEVIATPTPEPSVTSQPPTPSPVGELCPPESECLAFGIVPGSDELRPDDDGFSTWLHVFDFTGAGLFTNATGGGSGNLTSGASGHSCGGASGAGTGSWPSWHRLPSDRARPPASGLAGLPAWTTGSRFPLGGLAGRLPGW